jgi:hypothetical protein
MNIDLTFSQFKLLAHDSSYSKHALKLIFDFYKKDGKAILEADFVAMKSYWLEFRSIEEAYYEFCGYDGRLDREMLQHLRDQTTVLIDESSPILVLVNFE